MLRMTLLTIIGALALFYIGVCSLLYFMQERLLFFPSPVTAYPTHPAIETVSLNSGALQLKGWVINKDSEGPLLVYFGGNGEELSQSTSHFVSLPATSILFNYRGYGDSEGKPSQIGMFADAEAVVDFARAGYGKDRPLLVFGRSLGSVIAVHTAAEKHPDALILMSPFRSVADVATVRYRWIPSSTIRWMLRHPFDVAKAIDELPSRTLIIRADVDRVIPPKETDLFIDRLNTAPDIARYVGEHSESLSHPDIWQPLHAFVENTQGNTPGPYPPT